MIDRDFSPHNYLCYILSNEQIYPSFTNVTNTKADIFLLKRWGKILMLYKQIPKECLFVTCHDFVFYSESPSN